MEFKDRKAPHNGRVRVFDEKGVEKGTYFVDLFDGADVGEQGTPLNKQTFDDLKEELLEKMLDYNKIVGPVGPKGEKGEKGDKGSDGVAALSNGFFSLAVDNDGNLYAYSRADATDPVFEYDAENGNIYYITEE